MPQSLKIALKNDSDSSEVYAYITGLAIQQNSQRCLLKANGQNLYFPTSPLAPGSPLLEDCAIPLGPPGHTVSVTIPQMAGGRIWFSRKDKLTFLLNPGPALVEPSVLNPSDPNAGVNFGFCEFTLNDAQLYGNLSYVDFVPRIPIAITLEQASGSTRKAQAKKDGQPWDKLIVQKDGRNLRILNATHGNAVGASFDGFYEPYVEKVWQKYSGGPTLKINTQTGRGVVKGQVDSRGHLIIDGEAFQKPTTADILGCNSGPFTTGPSATRNAIIPRLAAAFVRSALLVSEEHPSSPSTFYTQDPTNHYARIVHHNNLDQKGYAFAYDDVQPDGGDDQSGKVNAGNPVLLTLSIGGTSTGHC